MRHITITQAATIASLLEADHEHAAEALFLGGIARLRIACQHAEQATAGRFSSSPSSELRRLRADVARALLMVKIATDIQLADNQRHRSLTTDLDARATAAARKVRGRQSSEATRVRLLNQACRAEGRDPTTDELYPWIADAVDVKTT